ncbi:MAG: hypothetical protein ACU0BK_13370 [Shimia sp.]|jgi:hypothetical protein|uniref:hypothetical protein n=1 Tax=Shimia sp. TaxID=1954381 RepID=UPI00405A2041
MPSNTKRALTIGALAFGVGLSPALSNASPYDGVFSPAGEGNWSCDPEQIGMDGGALAVMQGQMRGVENSCNLTNPTSVRGMNAMLFDAQCSSEGETYSYRVMLMSHANGIYVIQDGYAAEWRYCQ